MAMTAYDGEDIKATYDFTDESDAVNLMVDAREELKRQFHTLIGIAIQQPAGIPKAEIDAYGNKAALAARDLFRYRVATITGEPEDPMTDMVEYIKSRPLPAARDTLVRGVARTLRQDMDAWIRALAEGNCDHGSLNGCYTLILDMVKNAHDYACEAQGYLTLDSKKGA